MVDATKNQTLTLKEKWVRELTESNDKDEQTQASSAILNIVEIALTGLSIFSSFNLSSLNKR